jgi:hypothetical protein
MRCVAGKLYKLMHEGLVVNGWMDGSGWMDECEIFG